MDQNNEKIKDFMDHPDKITTKLTELIYDIGLIKKDGLCNVLKISRSTLNYKINNDSWKLDDASILINSGILNLNITPTPQ